MESRLQGLDHRWGDSPVFGEPLVLMGQQDRMQLQRYVIKTVEAKGLSQGRSWDRKEARDCLENSKPR